MSTAPCPTCFTSECVDTADTNLYSLESPLFPFVLFCPPGFNCLGVSTFQLICCGQTLVANFPPNISVQDQNSAIQELVNQCAVRQLFCGNTPTINIFRNRTQTCSVACPDGTQFTYTVPAGTFGAADQPTADSEALNFACQQAALRRLCLGGLPCGACQGSLYDGIIPTTGGVGPLTWQVTSGALPFGLGLNAATGEITGVPTLAGQYSFGITVNEAGGGTITKVFFISVLAITTTQLPAFSIGVPYSFQLQASGGSGNYLWKIVSGTLPKGLVLDNSGLIHGTPQ